MVYSSVAEAREEAENADWAVDVDGMDYCYAHWAWEDDDEGGHQVPKPVDPNIVRGVA